MNLKVTITIWSRRVPAFPARAGVRRSHETPLQRGLLSNGQSEGSPHDAESYVFLSGRIITDLPTKDMNGKLRLSRVGSVLTGSYWDPATESWILLGSGPVFAQDVPLLIGIGSDDSFFGHQETRATFEIVRITADEIVNSEVTPAPNAPPATSSVMQQQAPKRFRSERKSRNGGWIEWTGIIPKATFSGERISCLYLDQQETVWLGTSEGRVLACSDGKWTLESQLDAEITGIAVEAPGRVWFSTADGLRQLERKPDEDCQVKSYRTYHQEHPTLASGSYAPGLDVERPWGYVDAVYIPHKVNVYAPFVISTEHGLFSWGGYLGVWHPFLPHFWGANSPWLDTRDLIPHRRPTCMIEDGAGNLWVGTDGDGLVRFNASAREYFRRDPDHNQKDGKEFSTFGTKEIGCGVKTVVALSPSADARALWAVIQAGDRKCHLARFNGEQWTTLPLEYRGRCVTEVGPGVALVATDHGLVKVDFGAKKVERLPGFDDNVFNNVIKIAVTRSGTVLCASYWAFFERE